MPDTNLKLRAVLRVPSHCLRVIAQENDLLAPYKKLKDSVYNFAAEVNKICVKFFKENSFDDMPKNFENFNKSVLAYFSCEEESNSQPVVISDQWFYETWRWQLCSTLEQNDEKNNNILQKLYNLYSTAQQFYNRVCLPYASLQLHKQYEELASYFSPDDYDIFAEFDILPNYLTGDYLKSINDIENMYENYRQNSDLITETIEKMNCKEDIPDEEEKKALDAIYENMGSKLTTGYVKQINLQTTIPLDNVKFFIKGGYLDYKEIILSEFIKEHE